MGAGFIWFFVPETKQLSLEEMDVIFGASSVAAEDKARMDEINKEVGLDRALRKESAETPTEDVRTALGWSEKNFQ